MIAMTAQNNQTTIRMHFFQQGTFAYKHKWFW